MELISTKTETKPTKRLVEDFESFSISELGRGALHRDRPTEGGFWFDDASTKPEGRYRIAHEESGSVAVEISYASSRRHTPIQQDIQLESVAVTFGRRAYFRCPSCESRRNKLQVNRHGKIACRGCFDLTYQSTRESHGNPLFRAFRKHMKIRAKQAEVRRVVYNGRYTAKAESVLRMARKIMNESQKI